MDGRAQTVGEEIANSIIHGAALLGSFAALPVLIVAAARRGDDWHLLGFAVFGVTLVLLYLASTLYHALPASRAKHVCRVLDHTAIYLLIAGTYTPFALGPLRGPWGWAMLVTIWTLALLGIVAKFTIGFRYPRLSTVFYIVMGWLMVVALRPLITHVSPAGVAWLLAGGVCYTGGVVFYATDKRLRYGHALWHVFVVAGSACHFCAVLWHAAPRVG
jgi:hemolysin III